MGTIPLPSDTITTSRQFDGPCAPAVTTTSDTITRDLFAAHVAAALVATSFQMVIDEGRDGALREMARVAYEVADALMVERAKRSK